MRNSLLGLLSLAALILGSAAAGSSQSVERVQISIPFEFHAGTDLLGAGGPVVGRSQDGSGLYLTAKTSRTGAVSESARALFHGYGQTYFLAEVRGHGMAFTLPQSRFEKELLMSSKEANKDQRKEIVSLKAN
jgi:hypothetical protein